MVQKYTYQGKDLSKVTCYICNFKQKWQGNKNRQLSESQVFLIEFWFEKIKQRKIKYVKFEIKSMERFRGNKIRIV